MHSIASCLQFSDVICECCNIIWHLPENRILISMSSFVLFDIIHRLLIFFNSIAKLLFLLHTITIFDQFSIDSRYFLSFLENKEIQDGGPKMARLMTSCVFNSLISHLVERGDGYLSRVNLLIVVVYCSKNPRKGFHPHARCRQTTEIFKNHDQPFPVIVNSHDIYAVFLYLECSRRNPLSVKCDDTTWQEEYEHTGQRLAGS